jgi:hypothetical protein
MNTQADNRPTIAEALYPSVREQRDGKKYEPVIAAIPAATAYRMGKGDYTPWDKVPPDIEFVCWMEPPASSLTDYAAALHLGDYHVERPEEFEQAKKAMLALGFGTTQARAALAFVKRTAKHGRPPFTSEDARKAMLEQWGDKTDEKLAEVKAFVAKAKKRWPGVGEWLSVETGLGNDSQFITFLHRVVESRRGA